MQTSSEMASVATSSPEPLLRSSYKRVERRGDRQKDLAVDCLVGGITQEREVH